MNNRSQKGFSPVIIILVLCIIFLTGFFFSVTAMPQFKNNFKNPFVPAPTPVENAQNFNPMGNYDGVNGEIADANVRKGWALNRRTASGSVEIYRFLDQPYEFERWRDFLFWGDGLKLQQLNLLTGEIKTIFGEEDIKKSDVDSRQANLTSIKVFNDNYLFMSVSKMYGQGATFVLNLADGTTKLLEKGVGGQLEKLGGKTFLVTGFGDGCSGSSTYSLIDVVNFTVSEIVHLDGSCEKGEQFIGVDEQNRFLVAGYKMQKAEDYASQEMTYVSGRNLSNPDTVEGVIATSEMPPGIKTVKNVSGKNGLLLVSLQSAFWFDFSTKQFQKIADLPKPLSVLEPIASDGQDGVCLFSLNRQGDFDKIAVHLEDKSIDMEGKGCPVRPEGYKDTRFEKITSEFSLPSEYEFVKSEE